VFVICALLVFQNLPKSAVPQAQRQKAFEKIEAAVRKVAPHSAAAKPALRLLDTRVFVCEPLGQDSKGTSAIRVIYAPHGQNGNQFGVMPVFVADAKGSQILREFVTAKPRLYGAYDPETPLLYIRADLPLDKKAVSEIVKAIDAFEKA
jgi:hypothetical protein